MADRALTQKEMLGALQDIRLPEAAPGGLIAECFAAIGIGLLAALALSFIVQLFTQARQADKTPLTVGDRIKALEGRTEEDRILALLHLAKAHKPALAAALMGDLYRRGATLPAAEELEAALDPKEVARV